MTWFSFDLRDFAFSFLSILFEGIPFLLLGSLISGLVEAFVPSHVMLRLLPKKAAPAILLSGLLGLIFPICECGSVVVIRRFIRKGLPLSCAVTYMLAAPIVSPVVALSTFAAFKGQAPEVMTTLRLLLGFSIAVLVGFFVLRLPAARVLHARVLSALPTQRRTGLTVAEPPPDDPAALEIETLSARRKMSLALQSASADFLDVAFFLVLGAGLTAVFNTSVDQSLILPLATSAPLSVLSMMGLAFILALCSTSDAFIAASFVKFPFVAKLAFLLFGPMLDVKLIFLYSSVFRKRFVIGLAFALVVAVFVICDRLAVIGL